MRAVLLGKVFGFNDIILIHMQASLFCKVLYRTKLAETFRLPYINLAMQPEKGSFRERNLSCKPRLPIVK